MHHTNASPPQAQPTFVITRSWSGNFVWALKDAEGRVLETSTARFHSFEDCRRAVERIKRAAASATIQENLARRSRVPGALVSAKRDHAAGLRPDRSHT